MTHAEQLARFVLYLLVAALAGGIVWLVWHNQSRIPVDPRTGSAGIAVETDAGTGCQYVVTPWGGIFARLGSDGKPLCQAPVH